MTIKTELAQYRSKKKRASLTTFKHQAFNLGTQKSCRIDTKTVIFIDKNQDCETERTKYLQIHSDYMKIYSSAGSKHKKIMV